jgi:hypothetical protein
MNLALFNFRDSQIPADFSSQAVVNLIVARYCGALVCIEVIPPRVISTLA